LQSAQLPFTLPCGQGLQSAQSYFRLPCGQGLQSAQLPFSLPCGQGLQSVQLRFTLPCGQGLQSAQLPFSLPCEHRFLAIASRATPHPSPHRRPRQSAVRPESVAQNISRNNNNENDQ
jgi:hypothetical protein